MLVVVLRQLLHWGDGRNGGGTEVSSWLERSGSDNTLWCQAGFVLAPPY